MSGEKIRSGPPPWWREGGVSTGGTIMGSKKVYPKMIPEFDPDDEDIYGNPIEYIKEHPGNQRVLNFIKQDPRWAYRYAYAKGRWPEAEEVIKKYPESAYRYARYVIKGRWPEAEEVIKQDPEWWDQYKNEFL